jgi:hypothetical protein
MPAFAVLLSFLIGAWGINATVVLEMGPPTPVRVRALALLPSLLFPLGAILWAVAIASRSGDWHDTCGPVSNRLAQLMTRDPRRYWKPVFVLALGVAGMIALAVIFNAVTDRDPGPSAPAVQPPPPAHGLGTRRGAGGR